MTKRKYVRDAKENPNTNKHLISRSFSGDRDQNALWVAATEIQKY